MEEEDQAKTADACIPSAPTLDALILQTTPADNDNAVDKALQQDIGQSVAISLRTELILYYVRLVAFVAVVLVCLTWTACLLLLTVATNDTMNRVMDTAQLDYGSFWLVVDPPLAVVGMGVAGLSIVGLGYLAIPVLMYRQSKLPLPHKVASNRTQSRSISSLTKSARLESLRAHLEQGAKTRQKLSVAIKLGDLFIQFVFLVQVLNAGMAVSLVSFFASIVALNAFTTALWTFWPLKNIGVVHVLLDTGFDFLIAIIFPMAVVLHSIRSFHFDRPLMAIANQVFRDGAFERVALMVVDPMEFNVIRRNFDWLRIRSVLDIFTRVGVNLGLCVNFMSLAKLIILSRTKKLSRPNVYPRNRLIGVLFGLFAIAVTVFAGESVRTSMNACAPHPECVQNAHLWIGPSGSCPCITLVDRERYVRSFDEWTNPLDVSDKVNQLAAAGKLQTLQIVNRALHTLPENLRHCKNLRRLDLTYTDTTLLPEWTKEFTKLEYLHIEGKADNSSLASFPSEVFSKMDTLAFLHLGQLLVHQLPSLDNLRRLQVFNVVLLIELLQLPSFDKLVNLKRITLGYLLPVQTVPRLDFIPNLQSLNSIDRGTFCCNGFLGGSCNLVHPMCKTHPNFGTPPATCLSADQVATPKTLAYFKKFNSSVCGGGVMIKFSRRRSCMQQHGPAPTRIQLQRRPRVLHFHAARAFTHSLHLCLQGRAPLSRQVHMHVSFGPSIHSLFDSPSIPNIISGSTCWSPSATSPPPLVSCLLFLASRSRPFRPVSRPVPFSYPPYPRTPAVPSVYPVPSWWYPLNTEPDLQHGHRQRVSRCQPCTTRLRASAGPDDGVTDTAEQCGARCRPRRATTSSSCSSGCGC